MSTIQESIDPANHPECQTNIIPSQNHAFLPWFTKKGADNLPLYIYVDHKIALEANKQPLIGRMYYMSVTELQDIRKWIKKNLSKGFIDASSSSCVSRVYLSRRRMGPSASVLTTEPSTIFI